MAKKWFYIKDDLNHYGNSSDVNWACSGTLTAPLQKVNNTTFGDIKNPYVEYYYYRTSRNKNFYGYYNVNSSITLKGSGSFNTMQGGRLLCSLDGNTPTSTSFNHGRYGYSFTYTTYANTTIQGKYKLKSVLSSPMLSGVSIPINVEINGELCIEIISMLVSSSPTTTYNIKATKDGDTLTYIDVNTSSTTSQPILDFGTKEQDVPTFFKEWLEQNADVIYPYTYTIYNYDGNTKLGEIKNAPPIIKVGLYIVGNSKTLTLTGSNNKEYDLIWNSVTPEGKQFLGLSTIPESNRVIIPVGVETTVSWSNDFVLYEAYGTYRPPETTFNINLYQNTAEGNRVDKTNYLTQVGTLSGVLREESSITDVTITFTSKDMPTFNYVYIEAFNRYYYVNDITSLKKDLWQMTLSVDVLMTYRNAILSCTGFVDRNENEFNADLIDKKRVVEEGNTIEVATVTNELFTATQGTYLLNGILVSTYNKGS